jgi:hypothetical protein
LLGGPVVIGAIAAGIGLRDALLIPAGLAVLVAGLAGVMSPRQRHPDSVGHNEQEDIREGVRDGS